MTSQICEAAIELFMRKGYNEVSVNEICKAVRITKPTFYKYVRTKEDLLLQYYRTADASESGTWKGAENPDPWEAISSGFEAGLKHCTSLGTDLMARVIAQQISSSARPFQSSEAWDRKMISLIAQGQKTGQIQAEMEPAPLLEVMKNYMAGFCFSLCSQTPRDLNESLGCGIENLKVICQVHLPGENSV